MWSEARQACNEGTHDMASASAPLLRMHPRWLPTVPEHVVTMGSLWGPRTVSLQRAAVLIGDHLEQIVAALQPMCSGTSLTS